MARKFWYIVEVWGGRNVEHSRPRLCRSFTEKEPLCDRIIAERANVYNRSSIGSERRRDEETHLSNQRGIGGLGKCNFKGPHSRRPGAARLAGANPPPSPQKEDGRPTSPRRKKKYSAKAPYH